MRTLLLMRHAKSSWNDPSMTDHERPLNDRGVHDAPRMGERIADRGPVPDLVLCSTARRAVETADAVLAAIEFEGRLEHFDDLYHASPAAITEVVRESGGEAGCLLVVCHNPGIEEMVERLGGEYERMPTAAVARFAYSGEWSEFDRERFTLLEVDRPKELLD